MNVQRIVRTSVLSIISVGLALMLPWLLSGHGPTAYGGPGASTGYFAPSAATPNCFSAITTTTAYSTTDASAVQLAVDKASAGGTVKIAGTCVGVVVRATTTQTVLLTKTLTLQGGYTNTNWTTSYPITQPTTLDAQRGGRVVSATAAITVSDLTIQNGRVISDSGGGIYANGALTLTNVAVLSNTSESRLVVGGSDGGGGVRVMGDLYVTGGRFENNSVPTPLGEGGAIRSNAAAAPHPSVRISGTVFISNTAKYGGAISAGGSTWITNTQVASNTATVGGGGVYVGSASPSVTLSGCTIEHNTTLDGKGGGAQIASTDLMISRCTIQHNTTITGTGGGGVYVQFGLTVTGTQFIGNRAEGTEGAVVGSGGGLYAVNYASARTVVNTDFISNTADQYGGGLYTGGGPLTLTHTRFISNTSYLVGGGARLYGETTVVDSEFTSNHTISSTGGSGGGLYLDNTATVTGTAFTGNAASTNGGGLYARSALTLTNSTFYSNTSAAVSSFPVTSSSFNSGGGGLFAYGVATVSGSQFAGNSAAAGGGGAFFYDAATLVDAASADNTATDYGGGLFARAGLVMTDTQLIRNSAANGGGIYVSGYTAGASRMVNVLLAANTAITNGAALYLYSAGSGGARTATIVHTTIASPTVGASQAIFVGKPSLYAPTVNITNTIIASYTTGISMTAGVIFTADYNYFNNAPTSVDIGSHSISGTEHYLLFVDAAAGNYRLPLGSPAPTHGISTTVTTDLDGAARSAPPTIGAYEGTPYPNVWLSKTVTPTSQVPYHGVVTYTLGLNNTGSLTDTTVLLTDTLPTGVTFGAWLENHGASEAGNTITWTGTMVDLTGSQLVFTATHTGHYGDVITNTAWFSGTGQADSVDAAFQVEPLPICSATPDEGATKYQSVDASAVQQAVDAASAGDTVKIAGTCAGVQNRAGESQTVYISKTLTLAGGYAPASWTTSYPTTQTTILDAEGNGRVIYATAEVTLQDFNVTNGDSLSGNGGGIYASGAVTLTTLNVYSNTAQYGGGAFFDGAATLIDTTFTSNTVANHGGGAYFGSTANVAGTTFARNTANNGGGALFGGFATLMDTTFVSNTTYITGSGGGAYFNNLALLTDVTFDTNVAGTAGGGGAVFAITTTLIGGTFLSNTAAFAGGGAYFNATATLTGTAFTSNTVTSNRGGGAYFNGAATLTNTAFMGNRAANDRGGGAYFRDVAALLGAVFTGNLASSRGGGAYFFGVTILTDTAFISNAANALGGGAYFNSLVGGANARFAGNTANDGGGAYFGNATVLIGSAFSGNTAVVSGGGAVFSGTVSVNDTTFLNNRANVGGGAGFDGPQAKQLVNVLFSGNSAAIAGAAIAVQNTSPLELFHTTIASPTVAGNEAVYVAGGMVYLTNTIVASHTTGIQNAGGTVTAWNTLFYGNTANTAGTVTNTAPVAGDPLFVDPLNGDYHLGPDSPAVDAGTDAGVTTDFDGDARPQGYGYDIGYDEVLQQCGLSTGVPYVFDSPAITLTFSVTGTVNCAAAVYFPRAQPHAIGSAGNGVGADHFWQIAARTSSSAAATGFTATLTAPTGGFTDTAKLCFYPGALGGSGWDCDGTNNGDGTISRTITHFSDWAVGNNVGPTAVRVKRLLASAPVSPIGLALIAGLIAGVGVWRFRRRTAALQ